MYSRTWENADGTRTAEIATRPLHYQAADGTLQPISTTLTATTRTGFVAANETNPLRTYLPANAGGWVRVETGRSAVSFRPIEAAASPGELASSRAVYDGVAAHTSLAYDIEPGRLKETITLSAPVALARFSFVLNLEGLIPRSNRDGSVALIDPAGAAAMTIEAPWMRDARGNTSTAVSVCLLPSLDGYVYTLEPDRKWLDRAVYPVVIDPSLYAVFSAPGAYAGREEPTTWHVATPNASVGAPFGCSSGAWRTFLSFNATALPLDVEIENAYLQYYVPPYTYPIPPEEGGGYRTTPMTIEAREWPMLITSPTGVVWWNLLDEWVIGRYPHDYAGGRPKTYTSWGYYDGDGLDATAVVQSWADKRYIRNANDVLQTLPLNIVIRDVKDTDPTFGDGNSMCIDTSTYSQTPLRLYINYAERGWYTFQGNRRRTGHTQYPIAEQAELQWSVPLATANGSVAPFEINPSVLAIHNSADPASGLPVVYSAVTDGNATTVYRVQDLGGPVPHVRSTVLYDFVVKGTPLVLRGTSPTSADKVFLSGNTPGALPHSAKFFRLDVLRTGDAVSWTQPWGGPRVIENAETPSSLAFYPSYTTYTLRNPDGSTTPMYSVGGALLANVNTGGSAYMIALSVGNGKGVWGTVSPDGSFYTGGGGFGGLAPLAYPLATVSSPTISGLTVAYTNDASCWVNGRDPRTGTISISPQKLNEAPVYSTISLHNGRLYYGDNEGYVATMDSALNFGTIRSLYYDPVTIDEITYPAVFWTTGALSSDDGSMIFGNDLGTVSSVRVGEDQSGIFFEKAWPSDFSLPPLTKIRSSALVSGAPGQGNAIAFVGSDDRLVHLLKAATGAPVKSNDVPVVLREGTGTLNGTVRASMAAFHGRLYVLTNGTVGRPEPTLYCFE